MKGDPHDRLIKRVLGRNPGVTAFVKGFVPNALLAHLDTDTVRRVPGSFVDGDLRERITDVLISVSTQKGKPVFLYVLLEHWRTVPPHVFERLWELVGRIWEWDLARVKRRCPPLIYPMVIYNGTRPWTSPTTLSAAFDAPLELLAAFGPCRPEFGYHLIDLSHLSDQELRRRVADSAALAMTLLVLKHVGSRALLEKIREMRDLLRALRREPGGIASLGILLNYLLRASTVDHHALSQFARQEFGAMDADVIETTADRLRKEGIEVGRTEGIEVGRTEGIEVGRTEGIAVGRTEGLRLALIHFLESRFGRLPADACDHIHALKGPEIQVAIDRAPRATNLAEVFSQ